MTNEDLQQIQAIVHTAIAPLATRLEHLEQGQQHLEQGQKRLETQITAVDAKLGKTEQNLRSEIQATEQNLHSEIQASEKRIMKRIDDLETLAAHYQDLEIRHLKRRVAHVEEHLHITPVD